MTKRELLVMDFIKEENLPYKVIKYYGQWNGYNAYKGFFEKEGEINFSGPPLYILEKDGKCRLTDVEECYEVMRHFAKLAAEKNGK